MRQARQWAGVWPVPAVLLLSAPAVAHDQFGPPNPPGPNSADHLVAVNMVTDVQRVGPGQTFHLALIFDIEPQWRIYWKNPGEGAPPPQIKVQAPSGFEIGQTMWTRPRAFKTPVGPVYAYEGQAVLFVPVKAPMPLADGRVTLHAEIKWAVCKDVCVLGEARRSVTVETTHRPVESPQVANPILLKHRMRLPGSLDTVSGASVTFDGTLLSIIGPAQGEKKAAYFPAHSRGVTYHEAEVTVTNDRFRVLVRVDLRPNNALGEPMVLGGLVALGEKLDDPCYDFQLQLPMPNEW